MPVGFKKISGSGDIPVWQQDKGMMNAQGGFTLDTTGYAENDVIKAGTPMVFDESTRVAKPLLTGVMYAAATSAATDYQVKKGHKFKIGDNFGAKASNKAYPITGINTSNADYDIITVGTTIGAVNTGDLVFKSTTTGATNSSFGAVKGLLYTNVVIPGSGVTESVSITIRGTIYARRVPYSADLAAALPQIIYSQSY